MQKISGRCLCGAVSYEGEIAPVFAGNCHCTDCRKLSGNGHLALIAVPEAQINFSGSLKTHSVCADSGAEVSNHFCPNCGSQVYKTGTNTKGLSVLIASTLDDPELYQPEVSVYASRAVSWDLPNKDTQHFDEMPPTTDDNTG